jgi:hypothetical protein
MNMAEDQQSMASTHVNSHACACHGAAVKAADSLALRAVLSAAVGLS